MDTGKRGIPKLRDILRRQRGDSEVNNLYLSQSHTQTWTSGPESGGYKEFKE